MKKLFNHTKRPYEKWENYDEDNYDWDEIEATDEYYAEEGAEDYYAEETEGEYYAEAAGGMYYAEEGTEGYYAEEVEGEYYAEEGAEEYYAEETDGEYYAEAAGGMYYAEETEGEYYAEEEYYEEEYYEEEYYEEDAVAPVVAGRRNVGKKSVFALLWAKFLDMGIMDRIVVCTGMAVLIMALVTGGVYAAARIVDSQASEYAGVGSQLEGIEMIGEQGLLAVADAHMARLAAANAVILEEEPTTNYEENDYSQMVTVEMEAVSVQKDLKLKFTNQKNHKLISNVPFTVTITDPDGKVATWSDDDMDGIIYKKGITPGKYKVAVEAFTDTKYDGYLLPSDTRTVDVKKNIAYTQIDVSNEIKDESEVNAGKEDTKKNETVVESKLQDTLAWVESTVTPSTYIEVPKNMIPDPMTVASRGSFMRMAVKLNASAVNVEVGKKVTVSATWDEDIDTGTIKWSSNNTGVATVAGNGASATVTGVSAGTATITFTASVKQDASTSDGDAGGTVSGTCVITVIKPGTVTVDKTSVTLAAETQITAQATASGFASGQSLKYAVASNKTAVATATIDAKGKLVINGVSEGTAVLTVSVNYAQNPMQTPATATINVKVTKGLDITLDSTTATVYLEEPFVLKATVANATTSAAITAESSDTTVATVAVKGSDITITGLKQGSATITVKYVENGKEIKATCAVTVKSHPKNDKTTLLKNTAGEQLFVLENDKYREATYADYYTASKFFVEGGAKYTGWQTLDGKVYFFTASGEKATGEQVIQGAKYNFASDGSLVTGSGTMGIDVSKWNGTIDWNAVKNSGISYVIIRCGYRGSSQGSLIIDPKFETNIKGATSAGLKVGVYFFTQAVDEVEAVEEASMVLGLVKNYKISYPIFLDVEPSGGRADSIDKATRTAVVKAFCNTIQDAGYTAGVYANKNWLETKMNTSELSGYKIWLAQYAATPTYTGKYDLWQYSSTGKVTGISGDVDLNQSYLGY